MRYIYVIADDPTRLGSGITTRALRYLRALFDTGQLAAVVAKCDRLGRDMDNVPVWRMRSSSSCSRGWRYKGRWAMPGEEVPDWEIYAEIADQMGDGDVGWIFDMVTTFGWADLLAQETRCVGIVQDGVALTAFENWRMRKGRVRGFVRYLLARHVERSYAKRFDRMLYVGEEDGRNVAAVAPNKVRTVPLGTNIPHIERHIEFDGRALTAVFWGNLQFEPNVDAIQCISRFQERLRSLDVEVLVAGAATQIPSLIQDNGIPHAINYLRLEDILTRNCVAFFPVRFGAGVMNKILEAAAMAVPIICHRRCLRNLKGIEQWVYSYTRESEIIPLFGRVLDALRSGDAQRRSEQARQWVRAHNSIGIEREALLYAIG